MVSVNKNGEKLPIIADPELIFDYDTSLTKPVNFYKTEVLALAAEHQLCANQVPAGFACAHEEITDSHTIYSVYGQAGTKELFHTFANAGLDAAYFARKHEEMMRSSMNLQTRSQRQRQIQSSMHTASRPILTTSCVADIR